jgi:valyl-tRNA synthetase
VRFALSNLETGGSEPPAGAGGELGLADRWILARLAALVRDTQEALRHYEFSVYAQGLYDFIWRDLCDWYIEAVKPTVKTSPTQRRVLATCLDVTLRLLHPVMPFVTEELWLHLNQVVPQRGVPGLELPGSTLLIRAPWPKADAKLSDANTEADFELIRALVGAIREVRTTYKVPPKQKVACSLKAAADLAARLLPHRALLETLANLTISAIGPEVAKPASAAAVSAAGVEAYIHDLIEAGAERQRITKRLDELNRSIQTLTGRLASKSYTEKAPAHLVQQSRQQLAEAQAQEGALRAQLESL